MPHILQRAFSNHYFASMRISPALLTSSPQKTSPKSVNLQVKGIRELNSSLSAGLLKWQYSAG
jgi:hypothetical protein